MTKNSMAKSNAFIPLEFSPQEEVVMQQQAKAFYQLMSKRRSVRDFSDQPVPVSVLEDAILAAGTAPSGANMQPWHFVVVQDPEVKRKIREAAEVEERELYENRASEEWLDALAPLGTDANKPFLETAPALIAIFLKKVTIDEQGEKHKNYYTSE
ncbi:MAG: nitroreductase family protein, partial [Porticoccaceae bacterium]